MPELRRAIGAFTVTIALTACMQKEQRPVESRAAGEVNTAPSADSAANRNESLIRLVNLVPGSGHIDVYADDQRTFSDAAFRDVTPYESVSQNTPTFRLVDSGQPVERPLSVYTAFARDGHYYTLVAIGTDERDHPILRLLRDDLVPTDSSMARVRVVNAAARAGDVDVFLDSSREPLFSDLGPMRDAGFENVPPGRTTLRVRRANADTLLFTLENLQLTAGRSLTILLSHPSATSERLVAIRLTDELMTRNAGAYDGN